MATPSNNPGRDGARDFDFLIGHWHIAHRRLTKRLANCDDWAHFTGRSVVWPVLDGVGNVDDNTLALPEGTYRALSIRSYCAATQSWSIWWLDGRFPTRMDVPVVGRFENGIGTFYADDVFEGRAIRVRFRWSMPVPDQPRWEQAFSPDNSTTWETNWIMDFTRTPAAD
jgi:hypothetical protein